MSGLTALWLCTIIVAFSPVMGKMSVGVVSPALLVLMGSVLASAFFTPWLLKNNQFKILFARETLWKFFIIGTFGTSLYFTVLLVALIYTTPVNAAVMQQTEMIYSLLFAYFFLGERPTVMQLAGTVLIVAGVSVLLINNGFSLNWKGDLLIIGSTWMLQLGSTVAKKLPTELDYKLVAAARNFFALPVLILVSLFLWYKGALFVKPVYQFWGVLFYMGIFKYALAMIFWYLALKKLDLAKITALYLSYPVLSFILSVLLGFDKVEAHKILGMLLTLAGAYMMTVVINRKKE